MACARFLAVQAKQPVVHIMIAEFSEHVELVLVLHCGRKVSHNGC
jgi:hypothetical protein